MRHGLRRLTHGCEPSGIIEQRNKGIKQPDFVELGFFQYNGSASSLESFGIAALMIVGSKWKWNENSRFSGSCDFGDRTRSRAAQDQISPREKSRHIVDELVHFCRNARLRVRGLNVIIVTLSGLMDDANTGNTLQQLWDCARNSFIDGARALASTKDEQGWRR
jgi:hypothetical protein